MEASGHNKYSSNKRLEVPGGHITGSLEVPSSHSAVSMEVAANSSTAGKLDSVTRSSRNPNSRSISPMPLRGVIAEVGNAGVVCTNLSPLRFRERQSGTGTRAAGVVLSGIRASFAERLRLFGGDIQHLCSYGHMGRQCRVPRPPVGMQTLSQPLHMSLRPFKSNTVVYSNGTGATRTTARSVGTGAVWAVEYSTWTEEAWEAAKGDETGVVWALGCRMSDRRDGQGQDSRSLRARIASLDYRHPCLDDRRTIGQVNGPPPSWRI